jgi:hypothetical protein
VAGERLSDTVARVGAESVASAGDVSTLTSALQGLVGAAQSAQTGLGAFRLATIGYQKAIAGTDQPWRSEYGTGVEGEMAYRTAQMEYATRKVAAANDDLAMSQTHMGASGTSAWNDLQSAMESYYSSWQSSAAGITDPTQSVDYTQMEDQLGMHQDTFDENRRRAMSVVEEGMSSEWASKMGFGGQADALQYVKDFDAFRLPTDQYNWAAGAGQYAEQMGQQAGANNMQAMMQQYLQENGLGPDNPMIAQALGDPLGIAGGDAATAFADRFDAGMGVADFKGPAETAAQAVLAGWVSGIKTPDDTTLKSLFGLLWPLIEKAIKGMGDL